MSRWPGGRVSRATLVLMLLAVVGLGVGWAAKAPCAQSFRTGSGQVALDWRDYRQYTDYCYTDVIPLYGVEKLSDGDLPYKTPYQYPGETQVRYMEYPVLTGMLQYGVMTVTKAYLSVRHESVNPDPPEVVVYFIFMSLALGAAWLVAVGCTIPLVSRPRDAALMALSPLIAVQAFTNFDLLAVALTSGGMLAWARRRPVLAGVLFGLGAAAKLYPLFILGPLLVLCLRSGRMREWLRAFGAAALAWGAVNAPIALLYPHGWAEFYRLNATRPADHDTIYRALAVFRGWQGFDGPLAPGQTPEKLNLVTLGLFALACLTVLAIGLTAPTRPRVASLAFLIVAAFLLTNKVWSPQYSLWLVPLGVLALPSRLPLLAWMTVDAFVWFPRMAYFVNLSVPGQGVTAKTFLSVVLARDVMVLVICALIIRTVYRPEVDPVRANGRDDPAGGPLDGAPDGPSRRGARTGSNSQDDQDAESLDVSLAVSSPGSRRARTAPAPWRRPRNAS